MQVVLAITNPSDALMTRIGAVARGSRDVWPRLDESTLCVLRGEHNALASIETGAVPPRRSRRPDSSIAVISDGMPIIDEHVFTADELVNEDLGTHNSRLEGVFFIARADLTGGSLQVATDPLGARLAFVTRIEDSWIVANNALVLMRLRGSPRWDMDGVRLLMSFAGTGTGRSLIEGIRVVPNGHVWSWRPGWAAPREESYFGVRDIAAVRPTGVNRTEVSRVCDAMKAQIVAASATGRPIRAPITGGRDSRLLAAVVAKAGIECDFFTSASPESAEGRSAAEVAKVLGVRHRIVTPEPSAVVERWDELSRRLLLQNDGYVNVWQIGNAAAQDEVGGERSIVLGGHGGELSRTPFGEVTDFAPGEMSISRVAAWLPDRMVDAFDGLVRPEAARWTADYVRNAVNELGKLGWDARNVADGVAYFERQRTRDASAIRPGYPVRDMLLPYYSRPYARLSLQASIWKRYISQIHEEMIDVVAPGLRRVPYSQLPRWWHRPLKDLASRANRLLHWDRLRKKKLRTGSQQGWIVPLMPRIRATCLDAVSSRLWDVLDRDVFERFTSPSESSRLAVRADGILKAYSFFEYARLAGIDSPGPAAISPPRIRDLVMAGK